MYKDYVWVIHSKKKILVCDDPSPLVNGSFVGSYENRDDRESKVKELETKYPDYWVEYETIFWN